MKTTTRYFKIYSKPTFEVTTDGFKVWYSLVEPWSMSSSSFDAEEYIKTCFRIRNCQLDKEPHNNPSHGELVFPANTYEEITKKEFDSMDRPRDRPEYSGVNLLANGFDLMKL